MALAAEVRSVFEQDLREINALEQRIVRAEDDADAMLWEQARIVVEKLSDGMTQRELAAQWINVREGKPYAVSHVNYVKQAWAVQLTEQPRRRFREVYNEIANRKPTREPKPPEEFHWMNALDDLKTYVERTVSAWPEATRPLVPLHLRALADCLEKEWGNDGRGNRA